MKTYLNHFIKISLPVILFLITFILLSFNINKPFFGEHDWNGVRYGNIARNYLRYGIFQTKLGQVENSGIVSPEKFEFFTHYPPLLPLIITLSYRIFGISEWATRLVPIIFSSGIVTLIYLLALELFNKKVAVCSALLILVTPMILYFGKTPVHEPLVILFVLLALYNLLLYQRRGQVKFKLFFLTSAALAMLSTWAGYFLVSAITITALFKRDNQLTKILIPLWMLTVIFFIIHISHSYILTGNFLGGTLKETFLQRTSLDQTVQPENFSLINYVLRIRLWLSDLYTNILLLLSIVGIIILLKEKNSTLNYMFILGIFGVTYHLIFLNAAFIHNYLVFYLVPFLAISAGFGLIKIADKFNASKSYLLFLIVILCLMFLEKRNFLEALNKSDADRNSYLFAKMIKEQTNPQDIVVIIPKKVEYQDEFFLKFYSDRKVIFTDSCLKNLKFFKVSENYTITKRECQL